MEHDQLVAAFSTFSGLMCGYLVEHDLADRDDLADRLETYATDASRDIGLEEPNPHLTWLVEAVRGLGRVGRLTVIPGGKKDDDEDGPGAA